LAAWSQELLDPKTTAVAALRLEGLGSGAIEAVQAGLKSPNAQVRFFAAEALAYLNEISGVDVLGATAISQPEFRVYALAALASMDQAASHMKLRKLMDEPDIELRYGAFNALRTLDPRDPFLGQVRVLDDPRGEDEDDEPADSMAVAITTAARRRSRVEDPFALYIVDSEGPPLVHVSRTRRAEVVLFGRQQKLLPPIVLGTGAILLNAAQHDDKLELSKIVASQYGDADAKVTTSLDLAEVVRQAAQLGATYPEIVTILEHAHRQRNLPGQLVVDAVPSPNTLYLEAILGRDTTSKRDEALRRAAAESSRPRWRRLFDRFRRDSGPNPTPASSHQPAGSLPSPDAQTDSPLPGNAKKSDDGSIPPTAKKDDEVQKTAADPPRARRRVFDFLRRDDQP
jgi:hypothetical protein